MRAKQQPHRPVGCYQWPKCIPKSVNDVVPSHPQQGSRGVQGTDGSRGHSAGDNPSPCPGGPAGKPSERGCRRALTFPVKIIVWDANVDEALEDLQGEQRRAAGVGGTDLHPATGLRVPQSAHTRGKQPGARPRHPDLPCAAWPWRRLLPKHIWQSQPCLSNMYFSNKYFRLL